MFALKATLQETRKHIPPREQPENHRLKMLRKKRDMLVPRRVIHTTFSIGTLTLR